MASTKVTDQTRSAVSAQSITPSTTTTFYVGTAGNLGVKFSASDSVVTLTSVANGYHPLQVEVVTNLTTAGDVVALF